MKSLFFIFLISSSFQVFALDQLTVRKLYYESVDNKDSAQKFFEVMENVKAENPLLTCYKGMAHIVHAKHSRNPHTKWAAFNKGKGLLDKAVFEAPNNVEITFMRFTVQTKAPSFLGYKDDIQNDKILILKNWTELKDPDLKQMIRRFMLKSVYCTDDEKQRLR